jgi:hypothetical protein
MPTAVLAEPVIALTLDDARRGDGTGLRFPEKPLQNVQKSPLAGRMQPAHPTTGGVGVAYPEGLAQSCAVGR